MSGGMFSEWFGQVNLHHRHAMLTDVRMSQPDDWCTAAYLGFIRRIDAGTWQERSYRSCFFKLRAEAMFFGRCCSHQRKQSVKH